MGFLTRRDKTIPVQARRVDGGGSPHVQPTVVMVPGMGQVPASPQQPMPQVSATVTGPTTHNVIYVVNTPAAAPAVAVPPQEVHHHHHHTTQVVMPRSRRLSKETSFLGSLGFVIGALACGAAYVPGIARYAGPIALVGLAIAGLAWVVAVLLRRTYAGMPMLGIVASVAGYLLCLYNTGQAQSAYDKLRTQSPVELPAMKMPSASATEKPAAGH